ncbi:MAG: hypothetical protein WBV77_10515 [Solirubrobacteraceae bacterium]
MSSHGTHSGTGENHDDLHLHPTLSVTGEVEGDAQAEWGRHGGVSGRGAPVLEHVLPREPESQRRYIAASNAPMSLRFSGITPSR